MFSDFKPLGDITPLSPQTEGSETMVKSPSLFP